VDVWCNQYLTYILPTWSFEIKDSYSFILCLLIYYGPACFENRNRTLRSEGRLKDKYVLFCRYFMYLCTTISVLNPDKMERSHDWRETRERKTLPTKNEPTSIVGDRGESSTSSANKNERRVSDRRDDDDPFGFSVLTTSPQKKSDTNSRDIGVPCNH
jgi:hypothetical protein